MALQQTLTTSFKQEMLQGQQNLASDTLYIALYTGFATLGPTTTVYTTDNEVPAGNGYTAGGKELTGVTISSDANGVVYVNFDNVVWDPASFTTRGALIYNVTQSNTSVAVLDFGSDKICSNTFTVTMPVNSASTALLRFS
jgi:C-terminal processing protease CtpA/Prc